VETAAAGKDWQGLVWMRMEREIWREEETEWGRGGGGGDGSDWGKDREKPDAVLDALAHPIAVTFGRSGNQTLLT
jgi:hypothetical protein